VLVDGFVSSVSWSDVVFCSSLLLQSAVIDSSGLKLTCTFSDSITFGDITAEKDQVWYSVAGTGIPPGFSFSVIGKFITRWEISGKSLICHLNQACIKNTEIGYIAYDAAKSCLFSSDKLCGYSFTRLITNTSTVAPAEFYSATLEDDGVRVRVIFTIFINVKDSNGALVTSGTNFPSIIFTVIQYSSWTLYENVLTFNLSKKYYKGDEVGQVSYTPGEYTITSVNGAPCPVFTAKNIFNSSGQVAITARWFSVGPAYNGYATVYNGPWTFTVSSGGYDKIVFDGTYFIGIKTKSNYWGYSSNGLVWTFTSRGTKLVDIATDSSGTVALIDVTAVTTGTIHYYKVFNSWVTRRITTSTDYTWECITYGAGTWVIAGTSTVRLTTTLVYLYIATDLAQASYATSNFSTSSKTKGNVAALDYVGNNFVMGFMVSAGEPNQIAYSSKGSTWSLKTITTSTASRGVFHFAYGGGRFMIGHKYVTSLYAPVLTASTLSGTWTERTLPRNGDVTGIYYATSNGIFIVCTGESVLQYSVNGSTWGQLSAGQKISSLIYK
jgi:hypothetical protein